MEKECRLERSICEFWRDACCDLLLDICLAQACLFAFVVDRSVDLSEREILRLVARSSEEGMKQQIVDLHFVVMRTESLEFRLHPNDKAPAFTLLHSHIKKIEYYTDLLLIRLSGIS